MSIVNADYSSLNHESMAESIGIKRAYIPIILKSFSEEGLLILDELKKSVDSGDYAGIRAHAHAIKGSAGNINFTEIYEMAKEMEEAASSLNDNFEYINYLNAIKDAILTISH